MSGIDIGRIERARENRRQQLLNWERFDKECKIKPKKRRGKHVAFGSGTVFFEAAARDDFDEVKRLLEENVNPDVQNEDGLTALHQCCINNSIDMSILLLDHGANVNATDKELWTPLHAAATCGHKELCDLLIKRGADLLALNVDGNMPYDLCEDDDTLMLVESQMAARDVTQEQIDEIRLRPEREMLEDLEKRRAKGDDLSQLDSQGAAPIHIACACGYVDVARFLLECRVDPQIPDSDGWLPIHIAVCWAQMDIIELLVAYGADMNLPTQSGQTVYTISDSKDLRERLSDIWARRDELMRGVKRQPLGFQNSRSSVRRRSSMVLRRSVREKRNLTVMEARLEKQLGEREEAKLAQEMSNGLESLPLSVQSPSFTTTLAPTTTMVSNSQNVSPPVQPPPRANSSNKTVSSAGVIGEGQQITNFRNPDIDRGDHLLPRVSQNRFLEAPEVPNNATSDSKLCTMPPMPPPRAKKNGASDSTKNRNSSPQCSGPTSPAVNNSPADSNFSSLDKPPMSEKKTLAALARGSVTTPATSASPSSSVDSTSTEQAAKPRRIPPRDYILPVTDERTSPRRIVNGSGRRVKQIPANSPSHGDGSAVSETLRTDTPSNPTSLKGSNPSNGQQAQQTNVDTRRRYSVDNTRQENSPSGSHKTSINIPRPSGCCRLM
uniref:Uncharacterized protein n=1 Tax=Schistocephalus solidus TaxID=70667 RepID=A0A0X3NZZ0_SCHSO